MKPDPDNCKCWVGVALGHGGKGFVVAIGSSSCGGTSEGDFEKSWYLGMKKAATGELTSVIIDLKSILPTGRFQIKSIFRIASFLQPQSQRTTPITPAQA